MSHGDRKRPPSQGEQSKPPGLAASQPAIASGKQTLTMSLPPRPAGAPPPVQQKPDPAAAAARKDKTEQTARWMDTAMRPDLYPPPVQHKSAPGSTQTPGEAGNDVQQLAQHGLSGAASALPHFDRIQQSFGHHDVAGIEANVGGPAAEASQAMGAEAYATGNHVAFEGSPDLHTAAHEAAHVIQQRAGVQLAGGVGEPGDAYEQHADRVADAVVSGASAEGLLDGSPGAGSATPPASAGTGAVQRVPAPFPTNLEQAKKKKEIFDILATITEAERTTTLTTENDAMKNVAKKLKTGELLNLYSLYGNAPMTAHFMVFYAHHGKHLSKMSAAHWRRFVGFIGAEGVAEIRNDATMFGLMVKRAPNDVLPPWDVLDAAGKGVASPSAARIQEAVNALSAEQKTTLRGRNDILAKILPKVKKSFWNVIPVIGFPLLDAVKWMNDLKLLKSLKKAQWAQLLAEAPKAEQDALIADATLWPLVEKHCDPGVLQSVRQNTTSAANAQGAFDDPVQMNGLFGNLGAPAFLALATQSTMPAPQVKDIYDKIKAANKVMPTLTGLPKGKVMGEDTGGNLRRWMFDTGESDMPILYEMFERRFGVNTGDTSAKMANKHADSSTAIGDFTPDTLRMSWPVMERLPPAQVEGNPRWKDFLANTHAQGTVGNAYYWENAVVMGAQQNTDAAGNPLPVTTQTVDTNAGVYWRTDGAGNLVLDGAGNPIPVDMNMPLWNATLRHEIGHAVDQALNLTVSGVGVAGEQHAGAWRKHGSYAAFVDALIAANGGMRNGATWPAAKDARYRKVMIAALKNTDTFLNQLTTMHADEAADPTLEAGVIAAVWDPDNWTTQPWYDDSWVRIGGRCWQRAYDGESSLFSFDSAARAAHQVSAYQWRAPGEWFAEVYQVYYAEQEKSPAAPVGALLRSKDPQAAALMSGRVDRGFSPQDMRGGVTNDAPGT